jgi:hypothetical protein
MTTVDRWTGREARLLRGALRLSVRAFADYLGVATRTVSRWEQFGEGREPRPEFQAILDTALRQAGPEAQQRFDLLRGKAFTSRSEISGPYDPAAAASSTPAASRAAHTDPDELVAHLHDQWHLLVRTDNLLGPRYALGGVLDQLRLIEELLYSASEPARGRLVRLGSQFAESASWLYEDSAEPQIAKAWNLRAMEWANEADDSPMLAWTLFRRSQQAVPAGNGTEVVGLARAAGRDDTLPATMRAAIAQQIAHGLALGGDESATHEQLDEAHRWAATDTTGDARSGHGSFCTASYIELQRAGCWLTLGHPDRAIQLYDTVLPELPTVYRRDRGRALSRLATALVVGDQPEQAAATGREALGIAQGTGSVRTVTDIQQLARTLTEHRELPVVAEFLDEVAASTV